jgi:hypothetical protein
MLNGEERRSPEALRVSVERFVEVCSGAAESAFEARSVDLSGRGMHLVTSYALGVGDELVCRVDHDGTPIVVEGRVAWSRPAPDGGGEFGVQFTALDGGSVDALRELCAAKEPQVPKAEEPGPGLDEGAKVKLHIDGLAAPMKARVRDAGSSRVRVGSNLEFLKVGRRIDIQTVADQAGFSATVEGLEVSFDPRTQIPELVVTLRREGVEVTPAPSVVDLGTNAQGAEDFPEDEPEAEALDSSSSLSARELSELRSQLGGWARKLGGAARAGATVALRTSNLALSGLSRALAKGRGNGAASVGSVAPRRTAPPPFGGFSTAPGARAGSRSAPAARRQQNPTVEPPAGLMASLSPKARLVGVGSVLVVLLGLGGIAMLRKGDPAPAASAGPTAATSAPATQATVEAPGTAKAPTQEQGSIVAEVPLFGPMPMATMEPAPVAADEVAPAMSEGERELMLARAAAVEDEAFEPAAPKLKPEQVPAFQRGAMHLPVVHRLKLDGPGAALVGTPTSTGFKVVLAGRKVLDNGRAIERRDTRVLRVRTNNTEQGAEITFQFSGAVPGYKVRLKGESVEFFLSSSKNAR